MRRLLLVTYHYPPRPTVGSVRPMGLMKYLFRFGWECVVITPKVNDVGRPDENVIETEYFDVLQDWKRKLHLSPQQSLHAQLNLPVASKPNTKFFHTWIIQHLKPILTYPDPTKGWIRCAVQEIEKLAGQKFDAIVSTSPPISTHLIACKAKKILKCPWIADFRDLWTQNLTAEVTLVRPLEHVLERVTLDQANALVAVSEGWAMRLKSRYARKPVYAITNGFDPDDFDTQPARLTDYFSIVYTGQLYEGRRDPTPLLKAVQELIAEGILSRDKIRLQFYGSSDPWLQSLIAECNLKDVVELCSAIPRRAALQRQRESQILLQLGWYDKRETGQHTGKLFEYLGSRRPILALGGAPGAMSEVLNGTGAGVHVQSRSELRQYLIKAYREFGENGFVPYRGREDAINQYTHVEMARKYAELLNSLCTDEAMDGVPPVRSSQETCVPTT